MLLVLPEVEITQCLLVSQLPVSFGLFFFFGPQYTDLDKGKRAEVVFPRVPASLALKRQSKKGSERLMAQRQLVVSAVPSLSALLVLRAMPGV